MKINIQRIVNSGVIIEGKGNLTISGNGKNESEEEAQFEQNRRKLYSGDYVVITAGSETGKTVEVANVLSNGSIEAFINGTKSFYSVREYRRLAYSELYKVDSLIDELVRISTACGESIEDCTAQYESELEHSHEDDAMEQLEIADLPVNDSIPFKKPRTKKAKPAIDEVWYQLSIFDAIVEVVKKQVEKIKSSPFVGRVFPAKLVKQINQLKKFVSSVCASAERCGFVVGGGVMRVSGGDIAISK